MFKNDFSRVVSGSSLIAGTAIGAGMLGIPLLTAKAGFLPAVGITLLCWAFMLCTGLFLLEVSLKMPERSNLLSITAHFLGKKARWGVGALFLFLYYLLLVAYFAAGAPLLAAGFTHFTGVGLDGLNAYLVFGAIFALIVALGAKWIDRSNLVLVVAMFAAYALLLIIGSGQVRMEHLQGSNWGPALFAAPVLFSAFGYHNIIPSLTTYLGKRKQALRLSVIIGTSVALVVYLLWQWIILGAVPKDALAEALKKGLPATAALQSVTQNSWVFPVGQAFAFFALVTSLLGVSFSMVDFLGDALKIKAAGARRLLLTLLTFVPPFICVLIDPTIFDRALGLAGGFGEAILNGLLPTALLWMSGKGKQASLLLMVCLLALMVVIVEIVSLWR